MSTQKLIAGNWKMNGLAADLVVARELAEALAREPAAARVALCPAATLIAQMNWQLKDSAVEIGGHERRDALAAQERITLARGEYSLGIDPKTHLARYQILLPVRGSYPQLRRFLHALLGQLPAVVLEDVELQRKKIADTDLTGRIRMTLYLSRS